MASLHRQTDRPHWFCAFTTPAGKRYFKSTGTSNKQHAQKICTGWVKAAELASQKNLTPDRARKLIEATVTDVIESNTHGTLSAKTLKKFFEQAAELVEQPKFSRESINVLIGETVKEVAVSSGEIFPNASIRDWCKRWLETKLLEAAPRTHERYELSIRRFLNFIKAKADKDITTLRPDDVLRFRDKTAGELSSASANMDLKVVRACLNAAQRQDLINSNVASKVATIRDRSEIQRRAFSLAEVKTVLEQCDKAGGEWRGLVLAAVYTGQRLGDIAMLTWQQVDLDKNTIAFVTRKTTKRLNLSLATPLKKYFDELPSVDDPKEYVFPKAAVMAEKHTGTISTKFYDEILAPSGLVVERPKAEAKKDGEGRAAKRKTSELSFHSFRHTLTTWLKSSGASNAARRRPCVLWFTTPLAHENHGSPFLELVEPLDQFAVQVMPITINHDFFASVLGGRKDLGHHVIYFEPELQWYFKDSDGIYKTTTPEKLQNQYRALMMKCAQELPANVHKLNLVHEFRSDKVAKAVVQRSKCVLAADQSFFSPTSPHQRIKGPELCERLMRVLVETMLEPREGACLTVTEAYRIFCQLSEQRSLGQIKRSMFKEIMRDLIKDVHGLGLRRDVPDSQNKQQEAWRGLKLVDVEVLAT